MRYCTQCILPDTRPNIILDEEGVCNACRQHATKMSIDWEFRENAFREVVRSAKARSKGYDCLIPVSGGKDSTWQVIKCLEYGLRPLAVTYAPPLRTELGWRNLQNLIDLGVAHIDYRVDPKVERKFLLRAIEKCGSPALPMHLAIFSMPLDIAYRFEIPLIIWGENSAFEYGTDEESLTGFALDTAWFRRYGVTHGTMAEDWVGEGLTPEEMRSYVRPSDDLIALRDIRAVFLGWYFEWETHIALEAALRHGFHAREEGPKLGYYNYADIDDDLISVHHYIKWYKFGMTRTYDNLSLEIRNGRMTRNDAIAFLRKQGDETPYDDIETVCEFIGIKKSRFFEIIERFRNTEIWKLRDGVWWIPDFLIPDWKWGM